MARWILLGLDESEVDVLSRLPREEPGSVLVFHPDPQALVRRLADLAEFTSVDSPPEPRPDDVVVVTAGARDHAWVDPWRRLGASILDPASVGPEGAAAKPFETRRDEVSEEREGTEATRAAEPVPEPPPGLGSRTNGGESHRASVFPGRDDPAHRPEAPAPPSPDVWAEPESTWRWLLGEAGIPGAVLWWDGDLDVWVPWVGAYPTPAVTTRPAGLEIPSRWGRFVLWGAAGMERRLHLPALSRVAEDMALRDLEEWRRTTTGVRARLPGSAADDSAWAGWMESVLPLLAPEAAMLWKRQEEIRRLARAWGTGLRLSGELCLPAAIWNATFGPHSPWKSLEVSRSLEVTLIPPPGGTRWPLTLARLARLLGPEERG